MTLTRRPDPSTRNPILFQESEAFQNSLEKLFSRESGSFQRCSYKLVSQIVNACLCRDLRSKTSAYRRALAGAHRANRLLMESPRDLALAPCRRKRLHDDLHHLTGALLELLELMAAKL